MDGVLDLWVTAMRAAGRSERTIAERARVVLASGLDPMLCTVFDLERWLASKEHLAASSRRSYVDALRAFFKWMHSRGLRRDDPTAALLPIRVPRGEPRPITTGQLAALLSAAPRERTRGYLLLAAYQGLRVSEIARVQGEDVDLAGGTLLVVGKGGRECVLPLHPMVATYAASMPTMGWWFPSGSGHVTGKNVSVVVSHHMRRCGVPGSPHALRHWHGTQLVAGGANALVVQKSLRHANLQTTQIYCGVSLDQVRAAVDGLPLAA